MQQNVIFRNWTDLVFSWTLGGKPYTFRPGIEVLLDRKEAVFFAKHLVDAQLQAEKLHLDDQHREEYTARCFPNADMDGEKTEPMAPVVPGAEAGDFPDEVNALNQQAAAGGIKDPEPVKKPAAKKSKKGEKTLAEEAAEDTDGDDDAAFDA